MADRTGKKRKFALWTAGQSGDFLICVWLTTYLFVNIPSAVFAMSQLLHHRRRHARQGFTLIEMLIVIAAIAVLAGVLVPHVEGALAEATNSAQLNDLNGLTSAIERYRLEHDGMPPTIVNQSLPQLMAKTDGLGNIGTGSDAIFGPYLRDGIPANALNSSRKVYYSATSPPTELLQKIGWIYQEEAGQLWGGQSRQWSADK